MNKQQRKFTIGRNRACDLALADTTVSDYHAELAFIGEGKILLTDTNSSNGTFLVNGAGKAQKIRQELVSPQDQVRFGSVTLSMKSLLESLRLKFPNFEETLHRPAPTPVKPWVTGDRLMRCECGSIIRPEDTRCPECGR